MGPESVERYCSCFDIGKGELVAVQEQRKAIHKVARDYVGGPSRSVHFHGENCPAYATFLLEEGDPVRFGFEIAVLRVGEHKIQGDQARLDVLQFVLFPRPEVLAVDRLVELPSK